MAAPESSRWRSRESTSDVAGERVAMVREPQDLISWIPLPVRRKPCGIRRECDQPRQFPCVGSDGHGTGNAGQQSDVEDLRDGAIDAKPLDAVAAGDIDDLNPAPGLRIRLSKPVIQGKTLEALVARLRQADESIGAGKGETAHEARTEGRRFEAAGAAGRWRDHEAEFPGSGSQQPQA